MPLVHFTQYMMPDGRRRPVVIERSAEVAAKAREIAKAGRTLTVEMLRTGHVSICVEGPDMDEAQEVVPNGPDVPAAVDRVIMKWRSH